jgi:hypothetical protein
VYLYNPIYFCRSGDSVQAPTVPAVGVEVHVLDGAGRLTVLTTNAAGNFMLQQQTYEPKYPLWVKLFYNGLSVPMNTRVFRDGSCASCHGPEYGTDSAGEVHLVTDQYSELAPLFPDPGCPPL